MATKTRRPGRLKVTIEQRRVLLDRLRHDVANVVEDLAGTGESLSILAEAGEPAAPIELEAARLIRLEQQRLKAELQHLWDEYATMEYRRGGGGAGSLQAA